MTNRFSGIFTALCVAVCGMLGDVARGEVVATDSASNAAYAADPSGAWLGLSSTAGENPVGSDNGGTGFQPWNFSGGYHIPTQSPYGRLNHFIDGVDFPASAFNDLGGPAFALTNAQTAQDVTTRALRTFDEPLGVGDVFSLRFDSPAMFDPYGPSISPSLNITMIDATGQGTMDIGTQWSGTQPTNWRVNNKSGRFNTGISPSDTSDGSSLSLAITGATTATLTFDGQEFAVEFNHGLPAGIRFQLYGNTSGNGLSGGAGQPTGEREFFFDDLQIESPDEVLAGDYNDDGVVNLADYTVWRDNLGSQVELPNDSTSGDVSAEDYAVWKAAFGAAADAAAITASPVPEPSGWSGALLLATLATMVSRKAR